MIEYTIKAAISYNYVGPNYKTNFYFFPFHALLQSGDGKEIQGLPPRTNQNTRLFEKVLYAGCIVCVFRIGQPLLHCGKR